jgi:hypothetical protein
VTECFGSSVRVPAISSESPSSDAARASEMAKERTIGYDAPRRYGVLVLAQAGAEDAECAHHWRQGPSCIRTGYLRASVICPKW